MSKINFIDFKNTFYSINNNNIAENIEDIQNIENIEIYNYKKTNHKPIDKLYIYLKNSLNYQSQIKAFPSKLPEEINIKFTHLNIWEKINPFRDRDVAKTDISKNTIYISTEFLNEPKDRFLKEFAEKFDDKQSLIDAVFYHEFAHIIANYSFQQFNPSNNQSTKSLSFKKQTPYNPLYQVFRHIEENFSDAYASLLHKEKHNKIDANYYKLARNSINYGKTEGFDLNIYSLSQSFDEINQINLQENSIDDVCNQLYEISVKSALDNIEKIVQNNGQFKIDLVQELNILNQASNSNYIIHSVKELFLNQNLNNNFQLKSKDSIKNRMISIRNINNIQNDNKSKFNL